MIETSRNLIIQNYKDLIQLYSFYNKFFKLFPEINQLTPHLNLVDSDRNVGKKLESADVINQLIIDFKNEECVRDIAFIEEKETRLKISRESAQFLLNLQKKEEEFGKSKIPQKKVTRQPTLIVSKKGKASNKQADQALLPEKKPLASPYLDHAGLLVERHNYPEAITAYEIAHAKAASENDSYNQLRAHDGLTITFAHILERN